MRPVRGVAAALTLALLIFGSPLALIGWGRYPSQTVQPADGSLLLVVLSVLGWLAWGVFTAATIVEAVALATGNPHRLPALAAVQEIAGGLLVAAIAIGPISTLTAAPTEDLASAGRSPAEPPEVSQDAPPPTEEQKNPAAAVYTVMPGDDLWSVAEQLFGDGRSWRILSELNPQLADPLSELQPGSKLSIPETVALAKTSLPTPVSPKTVTVVKGDTLSELAQEHLGQASKWPGIAKANSIITDPDHIEVGWKLRIPGAPAAVVTDATTAPEQPAASPAQPSTPSTQPTPVSQSSLPTVEAPDAALVNSGDLGTTTLALGTLAAAAIVGTLEVRRAVRQRERPIGRYQPLASPGADGLRTRLNATQCTDSLAALTSALRFIGRYCHQHQLDLPQLGRVSVDDQTITLRWSRPAFGPPPGFSGDSDAWLISISASPRGEVGPCPYPALVSLGTASTGEVVLVDAEQSRVLGVCGPPERRQDALVAMGVELACAPWSDAARLVVVGESARLIQLAGGDRVQVADQQAALAMLEQVVTQRRGALAGLSVSQLRIDPNRTDAVAPFVFCFLDEVSAEFIEEFDHLLADDLVGVAILLSTQSNAAALWTVRDGPTSTEGHLSGRPGALAAHTIDSETREHLSELLTDSELVVAPWWREADDLLDEPIRDEKTVDIVRLLEPTVFPQLSLIGPAELTQTAGPEPTRSQQQLIELCAWLTEHPGATATQMAAGLAIAESTRRSNLSRLRNWLGADADGELYLPDAYSGRITLRPEIGSDWQSLQLLLKPGIKQLADSTLVTALQLIRGAPLANAAPGQWYWAEDLRTGIAAALRDVGVALTERALAQHDIDLARWAAARALVVAPEDELLLCWRLRTEHLAGNRDDTERLVNQLTRQARMLGVDLLPETVELCQQVIEGRIRAHVWAMPIEPTSAAASGAIAVLGAR